ncbi:hypothetical protein RvY_19255 [Ramazzottius varieornatus]|uniref:Uncharacterized protein n=1 Tax=Ramazzottius varieornatus TaxID=947166 RepID=A0A1D1WC68_RAMVA|nr:hypothetical protein RvY_19255 [Ramazzottius varieornatus]
MSFPTGTVPLPLPIILPTVPDPAESPPARPCRANLLVGNIQRSFEMTSPGLGALITHFIIGGLAMGMCSVVKVVPLMLIVMGGWAFLCGLIGILFCIPFFYNDTDRFRLMDFWSAAAILSKTYSLTTTVAIALSISAAVQGSMLYNRGTGWVVTFDTASVLYLRQATIARNAGWSAIGLGTAATVANFILLMRTFNLCQLSSYIQVRTRSTMTRQGIPAIGVRYIHYHPHSGHRIALQMHNMPRLPPVIDPPPAYDIVIENDEPPPEYKLAVEIPVAATPSSAQLK